MELIIRAGSLNSYCDHAIQLSLANIEIERQGDSIQGDHVEGLDGRPSPPDAKTTQHIPPIQTHLMQ